jgi:transcriptional regulator with XRE-family HTH domain
MGTLVIVSGDFGSWVRANRELQGLSQAALAKRAGIGTSTVGFYERGYEGESVGRRAGSGVRKPERAILINLATALKRSPDEALRFFDQPPLSDEERAELDRRSLAGPGPQREVDRLLDVWQQLSPEYRASTLETLEIAAKERGRPDEPPTEPTALAIYSFPARVSNRGRRPATRTAASG